MTERFWPDQEPWLIGPAGFIFQTPVRAKKHKQGSGPKTPLGGGLLGRMQRVAQRKPEVMVKVSGSGRNGQHVREHLAYITRNGKLEAEHGSTGSEVIGSAAVREIAGEWWTNRRRSQGLDEKPGRVRATINIVLSMPPGTDRDKMAAAASVFAKEQFGGEFDYMLVHHADTDHPHAHLTVCAAGIHGQCLDPRKEDLQAWREGFAEALRAHGVDAEATPRRARGVTRKGQKQAVRHMDKRQASRFTREKIRTAIASVRQGEGKGSEADRPWEAATKKRQASIRSSWRQLATALDRHGEVALALQVRAFVDNMPAVRTERDELLARVNQAVPSVRSTPPPTQERKR